jgi:hypothetical protein
MSQMKSRRELGLLATGVLVASGLIASAKPALARQDAMLRAKGDLTDALETLRRADDNKGGHRVTAIKLIEDAITEVNAGMEFAATHPG